MLPFPEIMDKIPILDCSSIKGENVPKENLTKFAIKFGQALEGIGFVYLTNHGLDLSRVRHFSFSQHFTQSYKMVAFLQ